MKLPKHLFVIGSARGIEDWCYRHEVNPRGKGVHWICNGEQVMRIRGYHPDDCAYVEAYGAGNIKDIWWILEDIEHRGIEKFSG